MIEHIYRVSFFRVECAAPFVTMAGIRQFTVMLFVGTARFAFRQIAVHEVGRALHEGAGYIRRRVVPMVSSAPPAAAAVCCWFLISTSCSAKKWTINVDMLVPL